jgi:hypothetical protein
LSSSFLRAYLAQRDAFIAHPIGNSGTPLAISVAPEYGKAQRHGLLLIALAQPSGSNTSTMLTFSSVDG